MCAHRLGEKIRVGASRTHRMIGDLMPPPQVLLQAVKPTIFHKNRRFFNVFAVVVFL
jgi:hypothetical protein